MTPTRRSFPYLSQREALAALEADNPFYTMFGRRSHKPLLYDYEVVPILEKLCGNDLDFFYENNSSLSLEELFDHFALLMPLGGRPGEPSMLCSPKHKQRQMLIPQALRMCKINLQAVPHGWDAIEGTHYIDPYGLPRTMAFDVDENKKPEFKSLYPHYHGHEIHDALDIAPPLCNTINPVSMNCQFIYEIKYSAAEWTHPERTERRFKRLRKILSWLFGADTNCGGHAMRSPWYLAAMHRQNPERKIKSKRLDVEEDALFHYSKWYEPHAYTLDEMEAIARYLCELHGIDMESSFDASGRKIDAQPIAIDNEQGETTARTITACQGEEEEREHTTRTGSGGGLSLAEQRELAARAPETIIEGERNNYLWSSACMKVRALLHAYRDKSQAEFLAVVLPHILELNARLPQPLPENEVRASTASPVKFYLAVNCRCGRSSEEATYINSHFRWGLDHISVKQKAEAMGVSVSTYYRRLKHFDDDMIAVVASLTLRKPSAHHLSSSSASYLKQRRTGFLRFNTHTHTYDKDSVTGDHQKVVLNHHHPPDLDDDMQLVRDAFAFQEEIKRNPRKNDEFFEG